MDEPSRLLRIFIGVLLSTLLLAVAILALLMGAGDGRWCESATTGAPAHDSYCRAGTPGYEWETER